MLEHILCILGIKKRPQAAPAVAPTHFDSVSKFCAEIRLHSSPLSCFAHAEYLEYPSKQTTDIIIHATAWNPTEPDQRVFTLAYTLAEGVTVPMLPGMRERVVGLVDHINALSCPVQMPAQE